MPAWKLLESNYAQVKQQSYEVAVLPLGATEPHALHLPYGTDVLETDVIGEKICAAAHQRGAKIMLLPTLPYGTETNLRQLPFAMNLNPSTLYAVVTDLVESLTGQGIHKIVLLNGHGGNEMKPLLRELYGKTSATLFLCNWYQVCNDVYRELFDSPGDHAGEMETSLMLAYYPDLVRRAEDGTLATDQGATAECRFEAVRAGWVSITRPWHLLTTNAGVGNPHPASAEKGRRMMDYLIERLAAFLVDLSAAECDDRFPF